VAHDVVGLLGRSVLDLVVAEDQRLVARALTDAQRSPRVEYRLRTGTGEVLWVESSLRAAPSQQAVVMSSRVIEARKHHEDELRARTTHDALTGLANRAHATERLQEALGRHSGLHVGLLFCDLDRFKQVNDRLGHAAGDELLRQVAARLRLCLRSRDLLARLGGDEFVVVLDGVREQDEIVTLARRVMRAFEAPFLLNSGTVAVGVSVGGVIGERGKATATTMLRAADAAMYVAKRQGGGLATAPLALISD
jgi:diguanylate cyclase (GGDEF)-like protein